MQPSYPTALALFSLLLSACSVTQQASETQTSDFLEEETDQLNLGRDDEPLLIFRDQDVDWNAYKRVKLDPVTIWSGEESAFEDFSSADQQMLADAFFNAVSREISKDYELTDTLEDDVLHIQIALTDAQKSSPFFDTISTLHPTTLVLSQTVGLATGKPAFVGEASVEARFRDGASGKVLAAAADRRVGSKHIGNVIDSWDDVQASFQFWASQLRYRLCLGRSNTDCKPPEA